IRANAKKLVVVVTAGSAVSMPEVYEMADALLYVWYPGEQGGNAVGDVIFGDVVPSGRLPVTVVESIEDLPPYEDYNMEGRTYKYMDVAPQFPFGFGLSYTSFSYDNLNISEDKIDEGKSVDVSLTVKNEGDYDADEVVQFYLTDEEASFRVPKQSLVGFDRIHVPAGESKEVNFTVTPEMMESINEDGEAVLESGKFKIYVGGSSNSEVNDELGAAEGLTGNFEVL
ncbi:MAG: glycoside hydrolase family 3 C-terminal domain-containing protein, partial [Marinilabiliaceae bacterium]